jgi:DNA-binding XRE family transcriptional regulator
MKKRPQKQTITSFVGRNLKAFRGDQRLSLDDVANSTGLSKAYLSQLESGRSKTPSVQIAYILWRTLEVNHPFDHFCFNSLTP